MKNLRAQLLATAAAVTLSGSAFAADMGLPVKAPAPPPIPYVNWQGFYIGGNVGVARLNATATDTSSNTFGGICDYSRNPSSCSTGTTGATAGVQVGYDWQSRYFVYGVVADWSWTGLKHTVTKANCSTVQSHVEAKVDWLASFRGRMGLAVDDTLVYITGGLALGQLKSGMGQACVGADCGDLNFTSSLDTVKAGWVAGLGVEHKLTQNWSVMGEFLYYDLGRTSLSGSNAFGSYTTEFTHEILQGRVGLNYRF
jgi:outer membrane immunogenic protein